MLSVLGQILYTAICIIDLKISTVKTCYNLRSNLWQGFLLFSLILNNLHNFDDLYNFLQFYEFFLFTNFTIFFSIFIMFTCKTMEKLKYPTAG